MDEGIIIAPLVMGILFLGLPWLILHYVTKWKQAPSLTGEDEKLLDELHNMARRLDERLETIERIVSADNPDFRPNAQTAEPMSDYDYSRRT